jgi:phosphoribosylanthranilate isomerase
LTKVKICGLTRPCDIDAVNEAKPDYIGFVFALSRRRVSFKTAGELRERLSANILPVGVFVDEPIENIITLIRSDIIEIIQLHGGETEEYIAELRSMTDAPLIKAVSVTQAEDAARFNGSRADYLLLDNKVGGSGKTFDWDLIGKPRKPFFLAGGLGLENIDRAVSQIKPFAVDISSGSETSGFKDRDKIISIVGRIRGNG